MSGTRNLITDNEGAIRFLTQLVKETPSELAVDTETYGLAYTDKYFALQFSYRDSNGDLVSNYLNCKLYPDEDVNECVHHSAITPLLRELFAKDHVTFVFANPKFDMHKLNTIHGIEFKGTIYCVLLTERILYNMDFSYTLANVAFKYDFEKDSAVEDYIKEHKCFTYVEILGKKTEEKNLHFDLVPLSIMYEYGCTDTEVTLQVYEKQKDVIAYQNMSSIIATNMELNKTVFHMERKGIRIDVPYVEKQIEYHNEKIAHTKALFLEMCGAEYPTTATDIGKVLFDQGITLPSTKAGQLKTDKDTLEGCNNAIATMILDIREMEKRLSTYYTMYRFNIDGIIHTNYNLARTKTLRLSCREPNLQNVERDTKGELYSLRSSFIPREGKVFLAIDYKAMEYRMAADVAGETDWVEAIMTGTDPHTWVAEVMGTERTPAKTINFLILYGGGLAALAIKLFKNETRLSQVDLMAIYMVGMLNSSWATPEQRLLFKQFKMETVHEGIALLNKAKALKSIYEKSLPNVTRLIAEVKRTANSRGYLTNSFGARYHCPDQKYTNLMVNHLIQGTGGCVVREAMNRCAAYLEGFVGNDMLLQIHDELLFEIDKDKIEELSRGLRDIMESVYVGHSGMKLECDAEYSSLSWNSNTFTKL